MNEAQKRTTNSYREGWGRIFGKKKTPKLISKSEPEPEDDKYSGHYYSWSDGWGNE